MSNEMSDMTQPIMLTASLTLIASPPSFVSKAGQTARVLLTTEVSYHILRFFTSVFAICWIRIALQQRRARLPSGPALCFFLLHPSSFSLSLQTAAGRETRQMPLPAGCRLQVDGKARNSPKEAFSNQNSPVITPSSVTSMLFAAGTFGKPGIVMMSPASATTKPAPALTRT